MPPPPLTAGVSPPLRAYLEETFRDGAGLDGAAEVEAELRASCADAESRLDGLAARLSAAVAAHSVRGSDVAERLSCIRDGLIQLKSPGFGGEVRLLDDLMSVAREMMQVQAASAYAETALRLDSLVSDVEDAASCSVRGKLRSHGANSNEYLKIAVTLLKEIEEILTRVMKTRSKWSCLISSVDRRVDHVFSVLRPQAIAEHRALLMSLGWPPPLSGSNLANTDTKKSPELANPLFSISGDLKSKYSDNFLSLCKLQELDICRKSRQLEGLSLGTVVHQPLWVIEELVNPVSFVSQHHFSKWFEKPELIFALVYKIARDFVDSMDEILQPLVDDANLLGYSCREEWISGMVNVLSTYLSKEIFPKYVYLIQESSMNDKASSEQLQTRLLWLHLIDLMLSFDKQIQDLLTNMGLLLSLKDDDNWQRISCLSVFCDRPEWLDIWADIENQEISEKVKSAIRDEKNWKTKIQGTVLESGSDDCKSPAIAAFVCQSLSLLIDRARPLPSIMLRASFIRMAASPMIREFLDCLLHRCLEAEALTALADDDALLKVSLSINAARYCESSLVEWSENIFFLEMEKLSREDGGGSIFWDETDQFKAFRSEWVGKVSAVVLRGFEAHLQDFLKYKQQWQRSELSVSSNFIRSLEYVQGKLCKLEKWLNMLEFVALWRSIAKSADILLFDGIFAVSAKFTSSGVERLSGDMNALFGVFAPWCLRPQSFFPKLSEGLKLLKIGEQNMGAATFRRNQQWLKENGISHLTIAEAEKILKGRVLDE